MRSVPAASAVSAEATGVAVLPAKLGARPAAEASGACGGCGHPRVLHSNGRTACKAFACTAGPAGQPCRGYVAAA